MAEEEKAEKTEESKVDYADFSDMMGSELPDTIEETPTDKQQPIDYFDGKETVEEPQEETAEAEAQPETSEEKPDSYWQSQHDLLRNQAEQDKATLMQEIEQLKTQLPQPKEEELVAPERPAEAFLDNPEAWAKFYDARDDYKDKVFNKKFEAQDNYFQQIEQERQQRAQIDANNKQQAYLLGKLQTVGGLTPEESTKALAMFSEASTDEDAYIKKLGNFYRVTTGQSTKTPPIKTPQTPPLATQPGETQTQKVDEADAFFGDMDDFIKKNY